MRQNSVSSRNYKRGIAFALLSIALVLFVVAAIVVFSSINADKQAQVTHTATATPIPTQKIIPTSTPTPIAQTSPLLFGSNLGLFTSADQVVTSAATRTLMRQIHIGIVRVPMRTNLPNDVEMQAIRAVKSIGAIPLIVLTGLRNPNVQADDKRMIQNMNSIFGNSLVYYEFGNEDDWNGVTITQYTTGWNTLIPQFKRLALNGKFIGPVSYQYSHDNLTTFLQGAKPVPDAISWHEYTCSYQEPANNCLTNLDKWPQHISDSRMVMQATLGTAVPIMITEWNYAADQSVQSNGLPFDDGKYNNTSFITAWTTKAMGILVTNQVFASMQYSVTNTALPLITYNNTLTIQGKMFQSLYPKIIHKQNG